MLVINTIIDFVIKKNKLQYNNIDIFHLQTVGYKSDIKIYKECIIDNNYCDDQKNIIKNSYITAKNIKNKLIYLVKIWKWKKSIKYNIDTDLYLNKLDIFSKKYKITLLENNTRYEFRLSDLVNYWIESLNNNQGLFSKPLLLKNPHTNLIFSRYNLYNIYFKLLDSGFIIPIIITNFFYSNMNEKKFSYDYYHILKENTIYNFIESNLIYEQWEQLLNMLHDFRKDIDYITFTNTISYTTKKNIWKKIKNIITHYLNYKYSCNPLLSRDSKKKTKIMLKEYIENNPDFGYTRYIEVMRYVPYNERRTRTIQPPPPPPPPPPTSPTPPPRPPTPPPIQPRLVIPTNPFTPSIQLSRTPTNIQNRSRHLGRTLSLFGR
jgi:hypothetical protein